MKKLTFFYDKLCQNIFTGVQSFHYQAITSLYFSYMFQRFEFKSLLNLSFDLLYNNTCPSTAIHVYFVCENYNKRIHFLI